MMQKLRLPEIVKIKPEEDLYENVAKLFDKIQVPKEKIGVISGRERGTTYSIAQDLCKNIRSYKLEGPFPVEAATSDEGSRIAQIIQRKNYSLVLSVGGGTVEDVTKYAVQLASKPEKRVYFVHFATIVSHDGLISPRCSIKNKEFISLDVAPPLGLIIPYQEIQKAPYTSITAAMGDVLGKLTAVKDWEYQDSFKKDIALPLFLTPARRVLSLIDEMQKNNIPPGSASKFYKEKIIPEVVDACIKCGEGMIRNNSTLGASGSEHDLSHATDRLAPQPARHGHQVALWTSFVMYLYEQLADPIKDIQWEDLLKKLDYIQMPVNSLQLGIEPTIMVKVPEEALRLRREERGRYNGVLERYVEKGSTLDSVTTAKILAEMKIVPA
ncbi:MAG: iron-containing alcohol dehydrogenase [Candidatus Aenigmarchaeota archaeon]|nr:iron-containing alcohol dehydrogenase [Candidatus Aenigmarchaeota archaeon]